MASAQRHSLAFVHLGPEMPSYVGDALWQARRFHSCPIYLVASARALKRAALPSGAQIETVACESLPLTALHAQFLRACTLDRDFRQGFWTYTTERLFAVADLMAALPVGPVFHLENDNLVYDDLCRHAPVFAHHPRIAAPFDNDDRCVAGLLYIRDSEALRPLLEFICAALERFAGQPLNDMVLLGAYRKQFGQEGIGNLPIVPPDAGHPLKSATGLTTAEPGVYSQYALQFDSIFDAAALGQYLGGIDPRNSDGRDSTGFVNESCLFDPSWFTYQLEPDSEGRTIPYLVTPSRRWRINNLHIHSKQLQAFRSDTWGSERSKFEPPPQRR